jgi:hypothetical protein
VGHHDGRAAQLLFHRVDHRVKGLGGDGIQARGGLTPAVEASLLILLEPVLNPVWTFILTGERPGPWALAGGGLILLATA